MISFIPKYEIGQKIYHQVPETTQGIIIDISYKVSTKEIKYLIAIAWDNEVWALERELSEDKVII